jgi:hypothetical protein
MNFGTEFTELAATVGSNKKDTSGDLNKYILTGKQWVLVIVAALILAGGIDIWLRASGL